MCVRYFLVGCASGGFVGYCLMVSSGAAPGQAAAVAVGAIALEGLAALGFSRHGS